MDRQAKKQAILQEALEVACFEGWNDGTLSKASVQAGFPSLTAKQLFPDGVKEVLIFYSAHLNDTLIKDSADYGLDNLRVQERIALLVRKRLELADPHKEAVRRASSTMALPWNYSTMMRSVWDVCDVIWRLAGDNSTDHNYYTKRSLLAKVYLSTVLFWLQDESDEHEESWEFLERRISNVLTIGGHLGKTTAKISKFIEGVADQMTSPKRYRTKRR